MNASSVIWKGYNQTTYFTLTLCACVFLALKLKSMLNTCKIQPISYFITPKYTFLECADRVISESLGLLIYLILSNTSNNSLQSFNSALSTRGGRVALRKIRKRTGSPSPQLQQNRERSVHAYSRICKGNNLQQDLHSVDLIITQGS